ncbi:MAG: ATP-binding protein [Nitrospiraceae bacterium]|nr:ATP-binding protein [Nitrospiraceae bacterium]
MDQMILIYITVFLVVILSLAYFMVRAVLKLIRKETEDEKKAKTEVGFVVDTFHDLVSKLKDKGQELETLKRRAEDRASSVALYNENILQSVPSGVVGFDEDLWITKMNHSAERILDLRESDVIGKGYAEVFTNPISDLVGQRKTIERAEVGYTTRSGKRIWLGLNMSPLKDGAENTIGQILVFTDLTELKAFQSQMELRERLSTLGEMSAGIAHELRNPMAVISGYTRILLKKVDDSHKAAVEAISREVSVMDRIITDFLSFARPPEPVLSRIDLGELIDGCLAAVQPPPCIRVEKASAGLPEMNVDEVLLRQAFSNLLQNAVEAMPDGGALRIGGTLADSVVLTFSDTGHGVPENIRDKIFLPFYTTKERGTGLGLSIVHKIVVSHGGTLTVDSGEQGTTFTIRLPLSLIAG